METSVKEKQATMRHRDIHSFGDPERVAEAAARRFVDTAQRAIKKANRFTVVLAGGSTPRLLYELLTREPFREQVDWPRVLFLFGDERSVPPDDDRSNYGMARETLLDPLSIAPHQVFRMKGEQTPREAAARYEVRLGDLFIGYETREFDLVLLGLGADGHTASLFPGSEALAEREKWVAAHHLESRDEWRLTLTVPALCSGRGVLFLVTGEEKAQAVAEAFGGLPHDPPHPAEAIVPAHGRREILVDRPAASRLPQTEGEPA
jgi:6-phosphogluconolactonase